MYVLLPATLSSELYKMISNSFQNYTLLLNMPAYCFEFNVHKQANVKKWLLDLGSTIEGFKERYRFYTTTITYIHARIQEFFVGFGGGRGVQARLTKKRSDVVFLFFFFVSPQLILQRESMRDHGFFKDCNFPIFHGEGRSNISRGFNFSQVKGVQLHISI